MVLVGREPTERLRQRRCCSRYALYRRVRQAFHWLVQQPSAVSLPAETDLVLIVDGLWFAFQDRTWVLYNMALRPVMSDRAYLLDPVMLEGKESGTRWRQALAMSVSPDRHRRIRAFVTDGFHGAKGIAIDHGWVLQRCHWHVLSVLRVLLGSWRKTTRWRKVRNTCYRLIREALRTPNEARVQQICSELRCVTQRRLCPVRLRYVVNGFVTDVDDFRAYIRHPELRLPRTVSAMESLHSRMRHAVRCTKTSQATFLRLRSLLKLTPTICCRAAKIPQN